MLPTNSGSSPNPPNRVIHLNTTSPSPAKAGSWPSATENGADENGPRPPQAHRREGRVDRLHRHGRRHSSSTRIPTAKRSRPSTSSRCPQNAAVNEFVMTVGDRHIRGIIREREEAEQIYKEASARATSRRCSRRSGRTSSRSRSPTSSRASGSTSTSAISTRSTTATAGTSSSSRWSSARGSTRPDTTDGIGAAHAALAAHPGRRPKCSTCGPTSASGHDISLAVDIDAGVNDRATSRAVNHQRPAHEAHGRRRRQSRSTRPTTSPTGISSSATRSPATADQVRPDRPAQRGTAATSR